MNTSNTSRNKLFELLPLILLSLILLTLLRFGGKWFAIEAWFVLEIFILTFLTRTVSTRISISAFSRGIYIGVGLSFAVYVLALWLGFREDTLFTSGILIPFLEELAKFLPVLLITYLIYKRKKIFLNPSDYLWISVLSGAGFSMIEKMYFGDVEFSYTYGPHLGGIYFFPDALSAGGIGYIGHSAATGLIGMCFGLGVFLKSKMKSFTGLWWILPLVGFLWITLEHAIVNISFIGDYNWFYIFKGGIITPVVFIILLILTLGIDIYGLLNLIKKHPILKKALIGESKKVIKNFKNTKWVDGLILLKKTILLLRRINIFVWHKASRDSQKL